MRIYSTGMGRRIRHGIASWGGVAWLAVTAGAAPLDFADPAVLSEKRISVRGDVQFERVDAEKPAAYLQVRLQGDANLAIEWRQAAVPEEGGDSRPIQGVAFWFRGDGSDQWACIEFRGAGSDSRFSYSLYVPLARTEWHEVRAHLLDLIPTDNPAYPFGSPGMMPAEGIASVVLGDRWAIGWNNNPLPPQSFSIARIRLISDAEPPPPPPLARPLSEVLKRLRDKQPVTVLCLGDSITAGTGLADRDRSRYATLLERKLRDRLGYEDIVCVSRAVGGARANQGRAWVARDLEGLRPDLITIAFGYNDKSSLFSPEYFRHSMDDLTRRLAKATGGLAAICPITTLPGSSTRFEMLDDYAQQIRELCAERSDLTCIDLNRKIHDLGREAWNGMLRDLAHPNEAGHEWLAHTLADWVMEQLEALPPK
ncbi:MAG: SGNH/GDSL hydrolase family protein [Kiritimatiellia bacterium]|nr:SGNH/GDSL hydrolase family protein [Kiritimatiellia bacterium]